MNGKELKERLEPIRPGLRTLYLGSIQKPFTREALASRIREALQG